MFEGKTEQFRVRLYPSTKQKLRLIATRERRTMAGVLDVLIDQRYEAIIRAELAATTQAHQRDREAVPA